jgi:hypothetical protein
MRNVAPTRTLARRSRQLLVVAFVVAAIGTLIAVVGLALFLIPLVNEGDASYGFYALVRGSIFGVGALLFLAGVVMAIRAVTWRTDNDLAQMMARVMEQRSDKFDANYTYIRNINELEIGYVDAVLVGPPGILVYRITEATGHFANERDRWLKENRNGDWVPGGIDVTRECVADIKKIREYFEKRRFRDIPVYGIVVFSHEPPETTLSEKEALVPICQFSTFVTTLEKTYLKKIDRLPPDVVKALVDGLYKPNG